MPWWFFCWFFFFFFNDTATTEIYTLSLHDALPILRQTFGERFPFVAACAAAIHAQPSARRIMLGIALDRHDIDRFRLVRVHVDRKSEIGWQISADLLPRITGVVAAHHVPMFLHEQRVRARRMERDPMHAMANFRCWIRKKLRMQAVIDWLDRKSTRLNSS